jgi:hypothetical protein
LLGKGLHCEPPPVCRSLHLIDGCEVASAQFLEGPKELVEAHLVEVQCEADVPGLDGGGGGVEGEGACLVVEESQSFLGRFDVFLLLDSAYF